MCERKSLPNPAPSLAPRTSPAISVTCKNAGYIDGGFHRLHKYSYRSSGTGHRLSFGSMVQNGKFSAAASAVFVKRLNKLLFPTFGKPTMPIFRVFFTRPNRAAVSGRCSSFFFGGGILFALLRLLKVLKCCCLCCWDDTR